MTMDVEAFEDEIAVKGYVIFRGVLPDDLLERLRQDIPKRQAQCRDAQIRNGITSGMEGAAHHVVGGDEDSLQDFLHSMYLDEFVTAFFGSNYILNSYGALNNVPYSADAYKHGLSFHRDVRTYAGDFRLMMNMLVMVHDFTVENGATKLVPGSHRYAPRPSDEFLDQNAVRALGKAGDIVLFDSNLWHSAAPNMTQDPRMALTLTFTRPFVKQQMDYPRMIGNAPPSDPRVRQLLGFNARVPASYDEWYQPPERRMYQPGQG